MSKLEPRVGGRRTGAITTHPFVLFRQVALVSFRQVAFVLGAVSLSALVVTSGGAASAQTITIAEPSLNWAGYIAPGTNITSVSGQWTVPKAGSVPGVAATWVGIGGFTTADLIQAGTQEAGSPYDQLLSAGSYSAWYELLPAYPVYIGDTVDPGDTMKATIDTSSSCTAGASTATCEWKISISDTTKGWTDSKSVSYTSSESSAEWIHEAPDLGGVPGAYIPPGGPVTVTFDGSNSAYGEFNGASSASSSGNIGGSGAIGEVALPLETAISPLDTSGDGFNVCTYSVFCDAPANS